MTKESIEKGNQLLHELSLLENAEIKTKDGCVRPDFFLNVRSDFFDVEAYNERIRLRRKHIQELLSAL